MGEGEKKKRRKKESQAKKVWNFGFCMETEFMYGFYEIMYEFPCLVGL